MSLNSNNNLRFTRKEKDENLDIKYQNNGLYQSN